MALKRGIVELEEYNDNWKNEYLGEEKLLKGLLGDRIVSIHHVGSTAIKGLKAKPIIDILLVVNSLDIVLELEDLLKGYGYTNRGPQGVLDRYLFVKGSEEARTHYVHIVLPNSDTYYNQILFRDYLNKYPEYVNRYCDLKQELAIKYADDRKKYTSGKSEFINMVIELAKKEYGTKNH